MGTSRQWKHLGWIALPALCAVLGFVAPVGGQPGDAPPADAAGPLVRVGEVDGRIFNEDRSSFDARGTAFVTRVDGDAVRVWDAGTLKPLTEQLAHPGLKAFVISGDGRTVLTRDDAEMRLWDVATSGVRLVLRPGRGEVEFAEVRPDGSRVLTVDADDPLYVNLWQPAGAGARLEKQLKHAGEGSVTSAQFDPSGSRIISHRSASDTFQTHRTGPRYGLGGPFRNTRKHYWYPYVAKLDPRGGQYAIPTYDELLIVDCETGTRAITSQYANGGLYPPRLFFSADGSRISTVIGIGGMKNECHSYSADTGKFQRAFAPGMDTCRLFGPGGGLAICDVHPTANGPDRPAELWDVEAGKVLQRIADEWPRDVSPDTKTVLFHTPANRTSVWRLRDRPS